MDTRNPIGDNLERLQLRAGLTAAMRAMESDAARFDQLGLPAEGAATRQMIEVAQAALDGPGAVDELWKRRQSTLKAA